MLATIIFILVIAAILGRFWKAIEIMISMFLFLILLSFFIAVVTV